MIEALTGVLFAWGVFTYSKTEWGFLRHSYLLKGALVHKDAWFLCFGFVIVRNTRAEGMVFLLKKRIGFGRVLVDIGVYLREDAKHDLDHPLVNGKRYQLPTMSI